MADYISQSELVDLPDICEIHDGLSCPTVAAIADAMSMETNEPLITPIFNPTGFADAIPLPRRVASENWQYCLSNATKQLYHDKTIPLSHFGDFHQIRTGNPLVSDDAKSMGRSQRQGRGMFYTPSPIVDYLVAKTLEPHLSGRSPEDILDLRIFDPSCGCGAFLIACFHYLSSWLEKQPDCDSGTIRLILHGVLKNVLHGCDIDPHAVSWTIRSLRLAAWEAFRRGMENHVEGMSLAIPSLEQNVQCESFLDARPFQESGKSLGESYDVIIGGPPFVRLEKLYSSQSSQVLQHRRRYLSARRGRYDLYMLFIEQAIDLLKDGGRIAFSLSNSFLRSDSGRLIRGYVAANSSVEEIVEFDDPGTYDDAATQIALLRLHKTRRRGVGRYAVIRGRGGLRYKLEKLHANQPNTDIQVTKMLPEATASSRWRLTSLEEASWLDEVRKECVPLGSLATITTGLSTGNGQLLLFRVKGRGSRGTLVVEARNQPGKVVHLEEASMRHVVRGYQLNGNLSPRIQHVHPYPYDEHGRLLSKSECMSKFPLLFQYLSSNREDLSQRSLANGLPWYATFCSRPAQTTQDARLMTSKITSSRGFSYIEDPGLLAHNSVVVLTPQVDKVDPFFLLGIVNSSLFDRYVSLTMPKVNLERYSLRLSRLRRFPIPALTSEKYHSNVLDISSLAQSIIKASCPRGNQLEELKRSLDREVFNLYGIDL